MLDYKKMKLDKKNPDVSKPNPLETETNSKPSSRGLMLFGNKRREFIVALSFWKMCNRMVMYLIRIRTVLKPY